MSPTFDRRIIIQIALFIIYLTGLIAAIFNFSEDQIASILSISKTEFNNAPLLLNKLGNSFRFSLILFFVTIYLLSVMAYNLFNKKKTGVIKTNIESHENQIQNIYKYLISETNVQSLKIWGYSLNWASGISSLLHENPRHGLKVKLFIPDLNTVEMLADDEYRKERKTVLNLRLKEWKKLRFDNFIKSLDIYYQNTIPNDLGVIVDGKLGFLGTYNWEQQKDGKVKHVRVDINKRVRYELNHKEALSKFFCEYHNQRLICRENDSKHEEI